MRKDYRICCKCEMVPATHAFFFTVLKPLCADCYYLVCYDWLKDYRERYLQPISKPYGEEALRDIANAVFKDNFKRGRPKPVFIISTGSGGSALYERYLNMPVMETIRDMRGSFSESGHIDEIEWARRYPGNWSEALDKVVKSRVLEIQSIEEPCNNHENDNVPLGNNHSHFTHDWRKGKRGRR